MQQDPIRQQELYQRQLLSLAFPDQRRQRPSRLHTAKIIVAWVLMLSFMAVLWFEIIYPKTYGAEEHCADSIYNCMEDMMPARLR